MRARILLGLLLWPVLLPAANWQLVWSQEFNDAAGTAIDPTWWNQETGGGGWGNNELECYTAGTNNCFEDGAGNLVLRAKNESACGGANSYDSARLTTQNKFEIYCGRIEARLQVPPGQGLWPAWWMLGRNIGSVGWPACGETDIMETVNQPNNWSAGSLHMTGDNYTWTAQYDLPSGNFSDGYHVFTCYWTPTSITYAIDGNNFSTTNSGQPPSWPFNQPSFLLLNLAVGGNWPGAPNGSTPFPADYKVDYIHIYKDQDLVQAYNGATPNIPGRVENENYDDGGYGLAYMDNDPANKGGAYRLNEWVDIESDASDSNGNNLCWTDAGEWEQYTVNATVAGSYQVSFRVASAGNGGTYHLTADGANVTGTLTAPNSGGWHTWAAQVAGPFSLSAGTHVIRLYLDGVGATGSVANFDCMDFSLVTPTNTPTFTPTPTPWPAGAGSGVCGQYFSNATLSGLPCSYQSDAQINNPGPSITAAGCGTMGTDYSVRWQGLLEAPVSEAFTLYTNSDDGVRLYITNPATGVETLIIDKWVTQGATEWSGSPPFNFVAGTRYPFRLEYFQGVGGATISLSWASADTAKQLVPANRLYQPLTGCVLPTPTTTPGTCAAWVVNGSAFSSANGVTLTPAGGGLGSAFSPNCVNLGADFNRTFMVYFGVPGGADGVDFVLQQDPRGTAALGAGGGAKGYVGPGAITPSMAFDLETYNSNGVLQVLEDGSAVNTCSHAVGSCPYTFPNNLANGAEHSYQVAWSAAAKTLRLYVDGVLVSQYQRDLVASVFGGNACAYLGFTAATGGSVNLQYFYEVGCAAPTATPSVTPSRTATPSLTSSPSASPSPSPTLTATPTPSATASPSGTATPTVTVPAQSPTASPAFSATLSPTPSDSPTASPAVTPSATPTAASATPTSSPTNAQSATPSASATAAAATPTPTPTASATAASSASPSPLASSSATPAATVTASALATALPSASATPTLTATRTPTTVPATASPTPTATLPSGATASPSPPPRQGGGDGLRVDQVLGSPNPNPGALCVHLTDAAESLELRVYSAAWVRVLDLSAPAQGPGWQRVPLQLPSAGVFYAVVVARRGEAQARSKPVVLMRTD